MHACCKSGVHGGGYPYVVAIMIVTLPFMHILMYQCLCKSQQALPKSCGLQFC